MKTPIDRVPHGRRARGIALAWLLVAPCTAGCRGGGAHAPATPVADASRGRAAIEHFSCGACHEIHGITDAHGRVGPMLVRFREQTMIAGHVPNTMDNLVQWIRHPQTISPGTAMPDLGIDEATARDIAAYLYTAR